jgi:protein-S-isoprenylcysteine O-methyltransferase Ste14
MTGSRQFDRSGTPIRPGTQPVRLVTRGVFRLSRNPMYLGMVLALGGVALILGRPSSLVVAPLFGAFLTRRFIRQEEDLLARRFGRRWAEYRRRVRRWL